MIKQALAKETFSVSFAKGSEKSFAEDSEKSFARADNLTGVSRGLTGGGPPAPPHPPALAKAKDAVRRGLSRRANFDMRVPQRYWGKTFPGLRNGVDSISRKANRAKEAVMNGGSLFLTGSTGSGKTHLAISLMFEWCAEFLSANEDGAIYHGKGRPLFVPAPELLLEIKETWDKGDKGKERGAATEKEILDRCSNSPLLVIDDLGAEKASEWSRGVFYLLVDRLYRNGKQVIITSNMDLAGLSRTLDDRVASRICEMGAVIDMGKTDWRVEGRRG